MNSWIAISFYVGKCMETWLLCHCDCPGTLPKAETLGTRLIPVATWRGKERGRVIKEERKRNKERERKGGGDGMEVRIAKPHMKVLQVIVKLDDRDREREEGKHTVG